MTLQRRCADEEPSSGRPGKPLRNRPAAPTGAAADDRAALMSQHRGGAKAVQSPRRQAARWIRNQLYAAVLAAYQAIYDGLLAFKKGQGMALRW
jgi:hypothetical protein